jgi:hypothetical protein
VGFVVILHLGVIDLPYATVPKAPAKVPKPGKTGWVKRLWRRLKKAFEASEPPAGAKTTGEVATHLENKYHVMEVFYELHRDDVVTALEKSIQGKMEQLLLGGPTGGSPFDAGTSLIEADFKKFLSMKEMDGLGYPGVPTAASLRGVNHRLKIKKGPARPSFIDTGLYESSFKAWVDE